MTVTKNLAFPVNLLSLLDNEHNSVISPYGIATVLAMAAEGSNDECLKEILSTVGFSSLEEMRKAVLDVHNENCGVFISDNSLELKQGDKIIELLDAYKNIVEDSYKASITEGRSVDESFVGLKNVASFNAKWFHKMERDNSGEITFLNVDGSHSYPAFLKAKNSYRHYDSEQDFYAKKAVKAIALPYKFNDKLVPYELVVVESEEQLSGELLQYVLENMKLGKCEVELPEFTIKNEYDLIPLMKELGLSSIFNKNIEAFDKIATEPLYANSFFQDAEIKVDECGTVAKAVTFMGMFAISCVVESVPHFCFNRPFQYFLRNINTGDIIFMGKVNEFDEGRIKPDAFVDESFEAEKRAKEERKLAELKVLGAEIDGRKLMRVHPDIEEYSVPANIRVIERYAFKENKIKRVVIPNGVRVIERFAFYNTPLEYVTFPSTLKRICPGAFDRCTELKELIVPRNVAHIVERNFDYFPNRDKFVITYIY